MQPIFHSSVNSLKSEISPYLEECGRLRHLLQFFEIKSLPELEKLSIFLPLH